MSLQVWEFVREILLLTSITLLNPISRFCYFFTFHINFEKSVIFSEDRLGVFCVFADVDCFESDYFGIFLLKTTNHNGNKYYNNINHYVNLSVSFVPLPLLY